MSNFGMNQSEFTESLLNFIATSPTAFHAVRTITALLEEKGFREIHGQENWNELVSGGYFLRRNNSSLIAFTLERESISRGLRMAGAHTDSPCLKVKPNPVQVNNSLLQLGVEIYGGALLAPWFDRDLSLAGRLTWQDQKDSIHDSLIDFRRPVAVIPSLAIHLNREANDRTPLNKQTELVPILMLTDDGEVPDFREILARQLTVEYNDIREPQILDHELFLYDHQQPSILGLNNEFIAGARLDNLLSCFSLLQGLISTGQGRNCLVVFNDHEEVGSLSACGAHGPFLQSVLERLVPDNAARHDCIGRSLFISADNAHAVHPNYADRYDKGHLPRLNGGPVIKYNANQRYATTSKVAAFYRILSARSGVPVQEFVMRSDLACGSTIGPVTAGEIGVQTLDIGVPTLAMHSIRELAGSLDAWNLCEVMKNFFGLAPDDAVWQCLV